MIAVDTNLLVYAHRKDSQWYEPALRCVTRLAEGSGSWAIPWPCLHEFLGVATHPKIYAPPTPLQKAIDQVEVWLESPSIVLLAESEGYWLNLRTELLNGRIVGPKVHDTKVAALCQHHGVTELWTADRDFSRFPALTVRNPLIG